MKKLHFIFWLLVPFSVPTAIGLFCWWAYGGVTGIIAFIIYIAAAICTVSGNPPDYLEHPSAGDE